MLNTGSKGSTSTGVHIGPHLKLGVSGGRTSAAADVTKATEPSIGANKVTYME